MATIVFNQKKIKYFPKWPLKYHRIKATVSAIMIILLRSSQNPFILLSLHYVRNIRIRNERFYKNDKWIFSEHCSYDS